MKERDPSSKNVDLIFTGVFYLDLVGIFSGLEIDRPNKRNSFDFR
jgi:hypothetical protein